MPKKKITLEEYKNSQEYKMWSHIEQLCNQYELSGDNYITRKDLGGFFWEPLWDRIYKFGVMLKHVPKTIKYIKGEWMRPLLYLEITNSHLTRPKDLTRASAPYTPSGFPRALAPKIAENAVYFRSKQFWLF